MHVLLQTKDLFQNSCFRIAADTHRVFVSRLTTRAGPWRNTFRERRRTTAASPNVSFEQSVWGSEDDAICSALFSSLSPRGLYEPVRHICKLCTFHLHPDSFRTC